MRNIIILVLLTVNTSIFAQIIDQLPEYYKDYKLIYASGKSEIKEYDTYSFEYRKKNSTLKKDAIYVTFRIYKDMSIYQQQVDDFTLEDATMEYTQMDMGKLAQENFSMEKLSEAMNTKEGEGKMNKSEEEVLRDDLKHVKIEDNRFTSADYLHSRNAMGHDTFRAVLTWGDNRYAQVTATSKADESLELSAILNFIKGFSFEKL